jgi:hypothetical protein
LLGEDSEMSDPPSPINIRNLSIKCGHCDTYQTLTSFSHREGWNVYTYECENDRCDPAMTRTLVEVPAQLDEFARRDPGWRGGGKHGAWGEGAPTE